MRFPSAFAALLVALTGLPAFATNYHLVDLGFDTMAAGVNSKHHVAGTVDGHAALYANGKWHERKNIHHGSRATGIDHDGNMVGAEFDDLRAVYPMYYPVGQRDGVRIPLPAGSVHGDPTAASLVSLSADGLLAAGTYQDVTAGDSLHCFRWTPGDAEAVDIGLPDDYTACEAFDVNKAGDVVGRVEGSPAGSAAFVYHDGVFTLSGVGTSALLVAVNGTGYAVGTDFVGNGLEWDGGGLYPIPRTRHMDMTAAQAVNSSDVIAGVGHHGHRQTVLLYSGGQLIDVAPSIDDAQGLDLRKSSVSAITDDGVILGTAVKGNHLHGFMLIPQ